MIILKVRIFHDYILFENAWMLREKLDDLIYNGVERAELFVLIE
jgi:hypothetical protein